MQHFFACLSNPTYDSVGAEIGAAKRSLYFWWWRYLRLSSDYWWLCKQSGKTFDRDFAKTYKDFGDVFSVDFEKWWTTRGTQLFSYSVAPPQIILFDPRIWLRNIDSNIYKLALIPNYLTKSEILEQFRHALKDHQPTPLPTHIKAQGQIISRNGLNKEAIINSHRAWCLNDALSREFSRGRLKKSQKYTQYWIGKKLNLEPTADKKFSTQKNIDSNRYLATRVKVSRYLSKANNIISNVEVNRFPIMTPFQHTRRWSQMQQAHKIEAIADGEWVCPESSTEEIMQLIQ
jgi:hypothetical protein